MDRNNILFLISGLAVGYMLKPCAPQSDINYVNINKTNDEIGDVKKQKQLMYHKFNSYQELSNTNNKQSYQIQ